MIKKILTGLATTTMAVGLMVAPASAHVTFGSLDLGDSAVGNATTIKISGSVTCNAGEKFRAGVTLTQGASEGKGKDPGNNCSGSSQSYLDTVILMSGPGFTSGPATACVRVQTGLPGGTTTHGANSRYCETIALTISASSNPDFEKKTSNIYDVATRDLLEGKAGLKYRGNKIEATFKAPLPAGEVVNIWVGAYNSPENCGGGFLGGNCSFADIFGNNPAADATLVLGASVIATGQEDSIKFDITPDMSASVFIGSGQIDLDNAEIHLLARTHGAPIEGELDAQMTSWGGGCATQTCTNLKFGLFPAL